MAPSSTLALDGDVGRMVVETSSTLRGLQCVCGCV